MATIIAQMFGFIKSRRQPRRTPRQVIATRPRYWCRIRDIGDLCQLSLERGALAI